MAVVITRNDVMLKWSGADKFRYDGIDVSWSEVLEDIGRANHITGRNSAHNNVDAQHTDVVRQVDQFRRVRPINADNLCRVGCNRAQETSVAAADFHDSTRRDTCDDLHLIEKPIVPAVVCVLVLLIVERGSQGVIGAMRVPGYQFQIEARYSRMREQQGPLGDQQFLFAFTAVKNMPYAAQ